MFLAVVRFGEPEPTSVWFAEARCRRRARTRQSKCNPSATAGAGGPSCGGPRTTEALASRTIHKESRSSPLGRHRALCGLGIAERNINALSLLSSVSLMHTAGMQITALFSPSFSQSALQSKASCTSSKGPASNPSIKRTVKGLCPSPAAYVKR